MLMNVLASALLFLFVGPFKHVSSGETKEAGVSSSQVKKVYIAVNNTLELNCSINTTTVHNIHPTWLGWKHNSLTLVNFTHIINNNTIQLRKNHTRYDDAGVYECGLFDSSKVRSVKKIVVVVGEKPKIISIQQFDVEVYGKPVQEVIVKWPSLQANVTNELFVGRAPPGQYTCKFNNIAQCRRTPEFQHEPLSCHIGVDVLGKLFNRSELLRPTCSGLPDFFRCDIFCIKVLVKNSFGTSESDHSRWNLLHKTQCPPLENLTVSFDEHHLNVSWQRPQVKLAHISYFVTYDITPLLTGKTSRAKQVDSSVINKNCTECAWSIHPVIPYARYNITAACNMDFKKGPAVQSQVTTREAAPSEAPYSCEVKDRSRHEASVSWKLPSNGTWNGKPNKFLVYYGDQTKVVNTSLAELQTHYYNGSTIPGVTFYLTNLDPSKNYTVRVAMCTGGGCGKRSERCFILDNTEDNSNVQVVPSPDETNRTGMTTVLVIAIGAGLGISLVALILWLKWRKRSQRKERPPLSSVLNPLTGFHPYDNPIDESPSISEDDQCYDIIEPIIHRPLLANVDGPVANLPVSEI